MDERIVPPFELPIVVSIEDEDTEDEDADAYAKEREAQRAEEHNAPAEGFNHI